MTPARSPRWALRLALVFLLLPSCEMPEVGGGATVVPPDVPFDDEPNGFSVEVNGDPQKELERDRFGNPVAPGDGPWDVPDLPQNEPQDPGVDSKDDLPPASSP